MVWTSADLFFAGPCRPFFQQTSSCESLYDKTFKQTSFKKRTSWETMTILDKIKSLFHVSNRSKNAESRKLADKRNPGDTSDRDDDDWDPYNALSEVAAPEPVQRRTPEELARRPSLEQGLLHTSHSSS